MPYHRRFDRSSHSDDPGFTPDNFRNDAQALIEARRQAARQRIRHNVEEYVLDMTSAIVPEEEAETLKPVAGQVSLELGNALTQYSGWGRVPFREYVSGRPERQD